MPDIGVHNVRLWYLLNAHGQLARVSASSRSMGQIACVSTCHDILKLTRESSPQNSSGSCLGLALYWLCAP